ncbi:MAG TPA: hypothetical protein VD902_20330 [Symbiobacteriaceae bacterium]|nr:hypothetical protein [Symbiobacteriaceae bacterium]
MPDINPHMTHRIRDRIQEILVADGVVDSRALEEANSLVDGLGYYYRVTSSTGLHFQRAYDGIEVRGPAGDAIETIQFDRYEEFF